MAEGKLLSRGVGITACVFYPAGACTFAQYTDHTTLPQF